MKYAKQFGIILLLSLIGEALHYLLPLPIPASVYGLLMLFFGLVKKWIPLSAVKETGCFLIEIMPLLFIPAAAGLLDSWSQIQPALPAYLTVTLLSTCTVMAVSGTTTQRLLFKKRKKQALKNNSTTTEE